MRKKFIVIHNIPSPYRVHLFAELCKNLQKKDIDFHVHFMTRNLGKGRPAYWRDQELAFPHTYWTDLGYKSYHLNIGMIFYLMFSRPSDFVLLGSGFDSFTGILMTLFVPRKKSILWTESNTKTPGKTTGLRGMIKRYIFLHHDYISVPPGLEGRKYVELYQSLSNKPFPPMIPLPNLVNEKLFSDSRCEKNIRTKIREELGVLITEKMALCPARLEPCKGLLEFFSAIPSEALNNWKFIIVGEGSLMSKLQELLVQRGLEKHVLIKKYVPYDQMPSLYAAADMFVLPSVDDQNPLSVVEALHSALPVLVSKRVGNYAEAVSEGETGWGFSPLDKDETARQAVKAFGASDEELKRMGVAAQRLAKLNWSTEDSIRQFLEALEIR